MDSFIRRQLRLPRLNRAQRLVRNLLVLVLALFLLWCSPVMEMLFPAVAFRRLQSRYLLPEMELLVYLPGSGSGVRYVASNAENFLLVYEDSRGEERLSFYPRKQGQMQVLPLYTRMDGQSTFQIFCWDGGRAGQRAKFSLHLQSENLEFDETYTAVAERQEEGYFLFEMQTLYYDGFNLRDGAIYQREYAALMSYVGVGVHYLNGVRTEGDDLQVTGELEVY